KPSEGFSAVSACSRVVFPRTPHAFSRSSHPRHSIARDHRSPDYLHHECASAYRAPSSLDLWCRGHIGAHRVCSIESRRVVCVTLRDRARSRSRADDIVDAPRTLIDARVRRLGRCERSWRHEFADPIATRACAVGACARVRPAQASRSCACGTSVEPSVRVTAISTGGTAMKNVRPNCLLTVAVLASALAPAAARADDALQVTSAQVTVNCPLTIGGSFDAKTSALSGSITPDPGGVVKGTLTVDLIKLETGISLRDRHLRNNYLEVQKGGDFAVAKFENLKIQKLSGKTTFSGTLTLHGQQRDVTGTAELQQDGKGYK